MKKIMLVMVFWGALIPPAFAGSCVSLDYQEMKEMPINDLVKEGCKALQNHKASIDQSWTNINDLTGRKPFPNALRDAEQCKGQIDRITRVLTSRSITEPLPKLCEQQAAGQTIVEPEQVK